jgi:hypothetical protein
MTVLRNPVQEYLDCLRCVLGHRKVRKQSVGKYAKRALPGTIVLSAGSDTFCVVILVWVELDLVPYIDQTRTSYFFLVRVKTSNTLQITLSKSKLR